MLSGMPNQTITKHTAEDLTQRLRRWVREQLPEGQRPHYDSECEHLDRVRAQEASEAAQKYEALVVAVGGAEEAALAERYVETRMRELRALPVPRGRSLPTEEELKARARREYEIAAARHKNRTRPNANGQRGK